MISIYQKNNSITRRGIETKEMEFRGLSTDTKPTELDGETVTNGSVFIEIDTQKLFFFDESSQTWKEA